MHELELTEEVDTLEYTATFYKCLKILWEYGRNYTESVYVQQFLKNIKDSEYDNMVKDLTGQRNVTIIQCIRKVHHIASFVRSRNKKGNKLTQTSIQPFQAEKDAAKRQNPSPGNTPTKRIKMVQFESDKKGQGSKKYEEKEKKKNCFQIRK